MAVQARMRDAHWRRVERRLIEPLGLQSFSVASQSLGDINDHHEPGTIAVHVDVVPTNFDIDLRPVLAPMDPGTDVVSQGGT